MTEEIVCDDEREAEIVVDTLDTAGIEYETETVTVVRINREAGGVGDGQVTTPDGGSVSVRTPDATDAAPDATDATPDGIGKVPEEGSKYHAVLVAIAQHDRQYPTLDDLGGDDLDEAGRNRLSSALSALSDRGLVDRIKHEDERYGNNKRKSGYGIATECLRRELAQYDPLNQEARYVE